MILQLILELLAAAPGLLSEIEKVITEMHSADPTSTKVATVANAAAMIATVAAQVANPQNPTDSTSGGGS